MKKSGAQILVDCLREQGVDTIFGYPGGAVLPIYDALYDADIRHILTRHEQGAAHAADGYARASGRPGVCLATSGPGATNLVTGIANAYMDSVPLVAFTGQVVTSQLGKDSFQEADITGITLPITKHNYLVKDVRDLARVIREAFHIATTGRPGPVLVDIPKDVSSAVIEYEDPGPVNLPGYRPVLEPSAEQLNRAAEAIARAERPVIYAGGGVVYSGAHRELRRFAELILAPVATTLMGLGGFPGDHPLALGMLGMHGSKYANYAVCECDLLIAVGVRFDDRVTGKLESFASQARIMHIDIDPAEIGKNVRVDIPLVGDVKRVLSALIERLKAKLPGAWQEKIQTWKKEYPITYEENGRLKPQQVIREIYRVTKGQARITTEVGQHQMWAAHYYTYTRPRTFISSGGLGTMGFGLPAAIGVQVACPGETVFDIAGDGSIQMNIQELATAVNYDLPVKVAILDNGYLGMVRQWQELFYNRRYSYSELVNPDFVKLAEAYGAEGIRVEKPADVRPALEQALATSKPVLIDFIIEREENVLPFVPPGESLDRMLG
ncbi:acetolactate synthase, large subunit [Desulfofundulus australicus DSM 11792]|uniref:Acetolactate synthase n=1 Tax=Desulfofundulus australicus DSM 11792 TaxID=1121425 RepID=A0A1M4XCG3_9FIRM|nr:MULTISPECIES: biosynthetic-type acetolactate synthase large subunit [Desulfofundulus]MDK2888424.1 acetolactate synthase large subunit [Thermoanaerobacter sp.]SHE91103.1 acetolactate synthase, large subunit [Desulfofundulus australicus DSM 11792]